MAGIRVDQVDHDLNNLDRDLALAIDQAARLASVATIEHLGPLTATLARSRSTAETIRSRLVTNRLEVGHPIILAGIVDLERYLVRLARHVGRSSHLELGQIHAHLGRAVQSFAQLRDEVLRGSSDDASDARREAAIGARLVVIDHELSELKMLEREVAHLLWPAPGRFQSIDAVRTHVDEQVEAVLAALKLGHDDRIDRAEQRLLQLGLDSDVASFLATGASLRVRSFRLACRALALALEVPISDEPYPLNDSLLRRLALRPVEFHSIEADTEEL